MFRFIKQFVCSHRNLETIPLGPSIQFRCRKCGWLSEVMDDSSGCRE